MDKEAKAKGAIMSRKFTALYLVLWLASAIFAAAHGTGTPEATLKKVFPDATGFTPRKKTLSAAQIKHVEELSGGKLHANDNPFTFYIATGKSADGSGVLGMVVLVDAKGPKGLIDMAIGFKRDGSITKIIIVDNKDDAALSSKPFLDQLAGKNNKSSLVVGKDVKFTGDGKAAESFLQAVRRGILLLEAASSG